MPSGGNLGRVCGLPLVASGDVHMHRRGRRALQDTLTAIRLKQPLDKLGHALYPSGERYLRSLKILEEIYPPELLAESVRIARRCEFSLGELRYEYPEELVPTDHTPTSWLRLLTEAGEQWRWPEGTPPEAKATIEKELQLISELRYEAFFLTIHDVVQFARSRDIYCQGRGSAANSVVCYCLGITEVDPGHTGLLFERFISRERNEPPDIDVDFEHQRREEVIQYIYDKYTRERAGLAATVITYKARSAIRDVGKALGFSLQQVDWLAKSVQWFDDPKHLTERLREGGFSADNPQVQRLLILVRQLIGFPRHLSQHVGGFVISRGPLAQLVPIENAAMPERTVIQWEKDDLEALGLLKVDVLGLGMLTAIRKAFELIERLRGRKYEMKDVMATEPDEYVYKMIQRADTVGVFQIESRAQMSMLPRLKPENYYDLVIEIAIVRPGPIQGDMVHPYLRRRWGKEKVDYPNDAVKAVLKRTLGVPIFQEQVMQIAMVAAGFTAGEADELRRSMAAWKRKGGLEPYEQRLLAGMIARGYDEEFAHRIFRQILGFGEYGFPESHSASFALLAYVSCWLKYYEPAVFTCGLLNSQPMGFYRPPQLIQDLRRHGVEVRPVDVRYSDWDFTLEPTEQMLNGFPHPQSEKVGEGIISEQPALRLGLRLVKGFSESSAESLVTARARSIFKDVTDLAQRAVLGHKELQALAAADALAGLSGHHRHRAYWEVLGVERPLPLWGRPRFTEGEPMYFTEGEPLLPRPTEGQEVLADYASVGLTLRRHPLALLRSRFSKLGTRVSEELWEMNNGAQASVAGLVIGRQRPENAKSVMFITLEDEKGFTNLIVWPHRFAIHRHALLQARLMKVTGIVQRQDGVLHIVVGRAEDYTAWLGELPTRSRDFH
ncbi:MAG: error-prone DNA polymerase [Gammaproteobacteria bacterium]